MNATPLRRWHLLVLITFLSAAINLGEPRLAEAETWKSKLEPALWESDPGQSVEFLILLKAQADLQPVSGLRTRTDKGWLVYRTLTLNARQTQAPLLAELARLGVAYRPYWIINLIWVRGNAAVLESLAQRPDIARIYANPHIPAGLPVPASAEQLDLSAQAGIEWNLLKVGADRVWAAGITGQGVVIGGQDTGYAWNHPALKTQYRGWNGVSADHDYNWHDAIHENNANTPAGNPCGFDSPHPCDDHGHGTHTMGTMVGSDGVNQVGMAPQARWIGCRNMEQGWGTPATYLECYQWFLAPWPAGGDPFTDGNPDYAPDVINNSWGCPTYEGCTDPAVMEAAVNNLRLAGILSVHSAGNGGPSCSTVNMPAATYDASFTVGNTDRYDNLAWSSSRGPVTIDGSGRIKPDISAPGSSIRSTYLNGSYATLSGTSMAGPHVAGLAALLISAHPELAGQPDILETLITQTAVPVNVSSTCPGVSLTPLPNNYSGWGRIDAWAAYLASFPFHYYFPWIQAAP